MAKQKVFLERVSTWHQPEAFRHICQCPSSVPEARQAKLQSLSSAVRSNSYRIDCRKLADCLITGLIFGII